MRRHSRWMGDPGTNSVRQSQKGRSARRLAPYSRRICAASRLVSFRQSGAPRHGGPGAQRPSAAPRRGASVRRERRAGTYLGRHAVGHAEIHAQPRARRAGIQEPFLLQGPAALPGGSCGAQRGGQPCPALPCSALPCPAPHAAPPHLGPRVAALCSAPAPAPAAAAAAAPPTRAPSASASAGRSSAERHGQARGRCRHRGRSGPARPGPPRTHRARRLAGSRRPEPQQRERPARRLHLRSHLRRRGSGCRATVLHRRRGAGRGGAGSARPPGSAPSCAPRRRRRTAMSGSRLLRGLPVSRGTDGPADRQTERPRRGAVSSLCPAAVPCVCVYVCSSGPPPAGCAAKPRRCSVRRTSPPAPRRRPAVLWFGCVAFLLSAFTLGRFCPAAVPLRARTLTSLRSLLSPLLIDAVAGHGRFWNGPGLAPNCTRSCAASRARSHQPPPRVCTDCRRQLV